MPLPVKQENRPYQHSCFQRQKDNQVQCWVEHLVGISTDGITLLNSAGLSRNNHLRILRGGVSAQILWIQMQNESTHCKTRSRTIAPHIPWETWWWLVYSYIQRKPLTSTRIHQSDSSLLFREKGKRESDLDYTCCCLKCKERNEISCSITNRADLERVQ